MKNTRRQFIQLTSGYALGFSGLQNLAHGEKLSSSSFGYGPLIRDPNDILDLPSGFNYKVIGRSGDLMTDGFFLPSKPDGMATFEHNSDEVLIIRNHEINPLAFGSSGPFGKGNKKIKYIPEEMIYDRGKILPCLGGTTTLLYNTKEQKVVRQFLSLAGTLRNCSGGPTPWIHGLLVKKSSWVRLGRVKKVMDGALKFR
jgi:secreted PhoX family phosphatase